MATKSILELKPPKILKYLMKKNSSFVYNILEVAKRIEPILNRISEVFPKYTLHDINHSIRILNYIYDLIELNIEKYSDIELTIIIYVALLHDIGMYSSADEIENIKQMTKNNSNEDFSAILKKYSGQEKIALQDYIRRQHANRSKEFILTNEIKKFMIIPELPTVSFHEDVALICSSHTESISWIENKLKDYSHKGEGIFNSQFIALLLRIGDILDIDSNRTPPHLFHLLNPSGISEQEWKQHFIIENTQKIIQKNKYFEIVLHGKCDNPNIHRKILSYIEWINEEIRGFTSITSLMEDKYNITIKYPVTNKIEPKGYKISDMTLKIDYVAINNLLMGKNIYGKSEFGVRELIQNSIDACKVRNELENLDKKPWEDKYTPSIKVILSETENKVIIKDNGIGMSLSILEKYFLNVGASYYKSDDYLFKGLTYKPIGNFGIGFLSCFMLSENVTVNTRHLEEEKTYILNLQKNSPYICLNEESEPNFFGTEIILDYISFMKCFDNKQESLETFIQKYFLTENISIEVFTDKTKIEIKNNIELPEITDTMSKNTHFINLENYCDNISGFIQFKHFDNFYKNSFNDFNYFDEILIFSSGELKRINDIYDWKFKDFLDNNEFNLIKLNIVDISNSNKFSKYYEAFEDYYQAFEHVKHELAYIYVFVDNLTSQGELFFDGDIYEANDKIVGNISPEDLVEFGHTEGYPILVETKEQFALLEDIDNLVLLYENVKINTYTLFNGNRDLYLRNVLIDSFPKIDYPLPSGIVIENIKINILSEKIIPTISRDSLSESSKIEVSYLIYKIIMEFLERQFKFSTREKELFIQFKKSFYSKPIFSKTN